MIAKFVIAVKVGMIKRETASGPIIGGTHGAQAGNNRLAVVLPDRGAEPLSIKLDGEERLWQADPAIWGRHAPLFFPFIARLRDGYYEPDGRRIDIPTHGFCRDRMLLPGGYI